MMVGTTASPADSAATHAVEAAVSQVWPGSTVSAVFDVSDGRRDYFDATGTRADGSVFDLTIYRSFDESELDSTDLVRTPVPRGRAWIGATDPDLTSVYLLGSDGLGLYVSLQPPAGRRAFDVSTVSSAAQAFARSEDVALVGEA